MAETSADMGTVEVRIPAKWIFAGLTAGLAVGLVLANFASEGMVAGVLALAQPVGRLWLNGLQMTIVPLVAALLFTGIARTVAAARAGKLARRALLSFGAVLLAGATMAALVTPALIAMFPVPGDENGALLAEGMGDAGPVPGFGEFIGSLVPTNALSAAVNDAILPLIVFMSLFAIAAMRLGTVHRELLTRLFAAIGAAMLTVIGWVLAVAPVGIFALSLSVAAQSGSAAIGALAHYIAVVTAVGTVVFIAAYLFAWSAGRQPLGKFARAMLPAQAVALSTQSSLATLPAMLAVCRKLGVREGTADLVLPLAVALFRSTGPAMNLAVAIYVAHWFGVELTPGVLIAGIAVATLTTLGAVSLPGAISFVTSIGPIALAMGVPVAPLALLVAVEMLPDLMRTVANVTFDVAVTAAVDQVAEDPATHLPE